MRGIRSLLFNSYFSGGYMNTLDIPELNNRARLSLAASPDSPRKLTLLYVGVTAAASLLTVLLELLTTALMADAGGLDGLSKRAFLSTVSAFFTFAVTVSMPFWSFGYVYTTLRLSRQETATPGSLFQGFRRIGAILGSAILQSLLYTLVITLCLNIASTAWMMSPAGLTILENAENILSATDPEQMAQYVKLMLPVYIIAGLLAVFPCLFLFYRLRLLGFGIMDGKGGFRSLLESFRLMKGRVRSYIKLDLHFWWYYLLQALCAGLAWLDVGLSALGLQLPGNPQVWALICYIGCCAGQLLLAWYFQTEVAVTYATAYDEILQSGPAQPKPQKTPKNLPWTYE